MSSETAKGEFDAAMFIQQILRVELLCLAGGFATFDDAVDTDRHWSVEYKYVDVRYRLADEQRLFDVAREQAPLHDDVVAAFVTAQGEGDQFCVTADRVTAAGDVLVGAEQGEVALVVGIEERATAPWNIVWRQSRQATDRF